MKLGRWITRTRLTSKPPFIRSGQPIYERAQRHLNCGEYAAAIKGFVQASEVVRNWADPCLQLGELALRLRQPEAAAVWFAEGFRRLPDDPRGRRGQLAALLLCDPDRCARLLGTSPEALPKVPHGHNAVWRSRDTVSFPEPPSRTRHEVGDPGKPTLDILEVVQTVELYARQWGCDNERAAARSIFVATHEWRRRTAAALGNCRLHLEPEWISNIGQLGLLGVLAKLGRLGMLLDNRPFLPPPASGPVANPSLVDYWRGSFDAPPQPSPAAQSCPPLPPLAALI